MSRFERRLHFTEQIHQLIILDGGQASQRQEIPASSICIRRACSCSYGQVAASAVLGDGDLDVLERKPRQSRIVRIHGRDTYSRWLLRTVPLDSRNKDGYKGILRYSLLVIGGVGPDGSETDETYFI
ncbi:hypothetical protein CCMSSC00406_0009882 [Pleurotus cornucopiae]|uniref:Uncharacterized protein n=1 Tax=Pleurotus cornucopiae TaxID=5321 RepID=A0ACB7IQV9_PLECO|nr:hypothetical protein CCMSSC00406_0009882 [Pleurotus cornucopiae]